MSRDAKRVVVPSHEELSGVNNNLSCSEPNCTSVFKSSSNLMMHMVKHHKKTNTLDKYHPSTRYACPVKECKYSIKSSKYFSKSKHVKQHYLKCHSIKSYVCSRCAKGFPTEAFLKTHTKSCGKKFVCSCRWEYSSRESLMTHCKRKSHVPCGEEAEASAGDGSVSVDGKVQEKSNVEENTLLKVCIASPPLAKSPRKPSNDFTVFPTHYVAAIALSELSTTFIIPKNCHIGVQTVETKQAKKSRSSEKKRKSSQETQTGDSVCKKPKISAETQTSGHLKPKPVCQKVHRSRKRSTETQTKDLMPFLSSVSNESLDGGIFNESSLSNSSITDTRRKPDLPSTMDDDTVWENSHNSCAKKIKSQSYVTTINSQMFDLNNSELKIEPHGRTPLSSFRHFEKLCNNETQTEIDSLFQSESEGTSTTETQTTNDLIEDLYSNMCTQTCSDASDLFDFNFVDIETQTAWPDL